MARPRTHACPERPVLVLDRSDQTDTPPEHPRPHRITGMELATMRSDSSAMRTGQALRGGPRARVATWAAARFVGEGMSVSELARELGRQPTLVRQLLIEAGVRTEGYRALVGVSRAELAKALISGYRAGVSITQLVSETGLSRRTVRQVLAEAGVAPPPRSSVSAAQRRWLLAQRQAGISLRALAEQVGCSYSTVRRELHRPDPSPGDTGRKRQGTGDGTHDVACADTGPS